MNIDLDKLYVSTIFGKVYYSDLKTLSWQQLVVLKDHLETKIKNNKTKHVFVAEVARLIKEETKGLHVNNRSLADYALDILKEELPKEEFELLINKAKEAKEKNDNKLQVG